MDLASIQYLRALAAIMVVVYHLEPQLRRMGYDGSWPGWLSSGVDLFFVISGFIMWVTTSERNVTPIQFYWKRIVRIVPLYWILTAFVVCVMLVSPSSLQSSKFDFYHVVASFLFIPWPHPVKGGMEPALIPGWTLNYEMFFYLIFGLMLCLPVSKRIVLTVATLLSLVFFGWIYDTSEAIYLNFYSSSIILEFALGMLLGWYFKSGYRISVFWSVILIAGGGACIVVFASFKGVLPRFQIWGAGAMAIVAGVVSLEMNGRCFKSRLLHYLGDSSYSLYLSHGIVLSAASQLWRRGAVFGNGEMNMLFSIFGVLASLVCGVLVYKYLELPINRFFKK